MEKKERDIILEIEGECGPKYEKIETFLTSPLRNVYYNAFRMTEHVIRMSEEHEKGRYERLYNIISFMGERGTGKTSAMSSFTDALKSFDEKKYREFIKGYTGDQEAADSEESSLPKTRFVVLENIDASLLENKEDIFEVVLAKMLEKLVERMQNGGGYAQDTLHFQNMKLIQDFESICKNKRNLELREKERYGEGLSFVELLRNLSGSMALRESFGRLVPEFLHMLSADSGREAGRREESFLVLNIDDLDLNKERGFDMLEQIHRYFMVPHVLIYLAVSESQLTDICAKHFSGIYEDSGSLARSYADKVLPVSQRIYMPVLLAKKKNIYVEKKVLGQDRQEDPNDYDIKETILWKIAHRTFVYFDGCGLKTHFYEPENIRELTNLYRILQSMKKLSLEGCSIYLRTENENKVKFPNNASLLETSEINYDVLLDDIYNRLAGSRLSKSQLKYFQRLYREDISRQGERFLHYIWERCQEEPYYSESTGQGYSLGEVLRGMYHMGRVSEEEKPLIHCFMALETALLTRLYIRSLYHPETKVRNRARKELLDSVGGSVVGSWGNYLLPVLEDNSEVDEGSSYKMGYMKILSRTGGRILTQKRPRSWNLDSFLSMLGKNNLLKVLELLLMCVTNWGVEYRSGSACVMTIKKASRKSENDEDETDLFRKEDAGNAVYIEYMNRNITCDVWGFVVNSARYEQFFSELHEALVTAISRCFDAESKAELEGIRNVIKKNSLLEEYKEWERAYGYAVLPFYNVDMLYNMEKRVRRECKKKYPTGVGVRKREIYDAVLDVYESMKIQLNKEDGFYKDKFSSWTSLEKAYSMCPYIQYTIGEKKEQLYKELKDVFMQFIYERAVYVDETRERGVEVPSEIEGF
ncbi:hypothetical protein B5E77_03335 [Lachnoclostridium sp. An131]|uniref:hypothetical protein n=1 Tax=Lachnoclostridium sp. An131 TaxID=1965555 RepID=UPI000B36E6AC|nr:hypothetical protein [Lachnoclostridium sp. An131]OUQ28337.1 hypothetical protein B5E77_03335 [Lachnoclostridium sp. An131]